MSIYPKQEVQSPHMCANPHDSNRKNDNFPKLDDCVTVTSLMTVSASGRPEACCGERCGQSGSSPATLLLAVRFTEVPCLAKSLLSLRGDSHKSQGSSILAPRKLPQVINAITKDSSIWDLLKAP